ncbi:MAG: hypothetical protein JXA95_01050, partial [Spirochaetales bacterium]|nr:hypothetical protein [Spirochaetales bacterium]
MPEIFSVLPEELTLGVNLVVNVFCILLIYRKIKYPIKRFLNLFFIFDALYYLFKIILNSNIDPQKNYRMQRLRGFLHVEDDLSEHPYLRALAIAKEAGYKIPFRNHVSMLAPFFLVFLVDASNFFLMLTLIYFIRDRDKQTRFLFGLFSIT